MVFYKYLDDYGIFVSENLEEIIGTINIFKLANNDLKHEFKREEVEELKYVTLWAYGTMFKETHNLFACVSPSVALIMNAQVYEGVIEAVKELPNRKYGTLYLFAPTSIDQFMISKSIANELREYDWSKFKKPADALNQLVRQDFQNIHEGGIYIPDIKEKKPLLKRIVDYFAAKF